MTQAIQEFVDSGGQPLQVDREAGVIRGVKLLGFLSRNGRRYLESALSEAAGLYEGAKVNVNHPKGHPLAPRDYQERIGVIRSVRLRSGEGLFGDLHFNPKHSLSEQLTWDAQHAPQNVGLSHNVLAKTTQHGKETVVEAIAKVQSVDLVADPATSKGLFEHENHGSEAAGGDVPPSWDALTVEQLQRYRPDLVDALRSDEADQVAEYRRQIDELTANEEAARRRERISQLLCEYHLPSPEQTNGSARHLVSEAFLASLMSAPDETTVERLVKERAALIESAGAWTHTSGKRSSRPVARDQIAVLQEGTNDRIQNGRDFAAAILG